MSKLHDQLIVIDGLNVSNFGRSVFEDMHRGVTAANCTSCVWENFTETMRNTARWKTWLRENADLITQVYTTDDIRRAKTESKTGIILGLGETRDELAATLRDLRGVDVRILTLGQYLRPSAQHLPVARYYHPDEFAELAEIGRGLGFAHVESGPLVRSSYHAKRQVQLAAEPPARQP